MNGCIPLSEPSGLEHALELIRDCLHSSYVSSVGPLVDRFEEEFARTVGTRFAVATNSGTAAIHLALAALGVGAGDLVLCADLSFIATANPVAYLGADIGLLDCAPTGWGVDPSVLETALAQLDREGRRPRAVVVTHVLGEPADLPALSDCCERWGVPLVEDAAAALGSRYGQTAPSAAFRGRSVGSVGALGCFSLNGNKIITAGGGGVVTTDDPELAARVRHLSTQAKVKGADFLHDRVGFNYRMTSLAAALALSQLAQLDEFVSARRRIRERYAAAIADLPDCNLQPRFAWAEGNAWLTALEVDPGRADRLLRDLRAAKIQARPLWRPISCQPPHRGSRVWGSGRAQAVAQRVVCLPSSVRLSPQDQSRVTARIRSSLTGVDP